MNHGLNGSPPAFDPEPTTICNSLRLQVLRPLRLLRLNPDCCNENHTTSPPELSTKPCRVGAGRNQISCKSASSEHRPAKLQSRCERLGSGSPFLCYWMERTPRRPLVFFQSRLPALAGSLHGCLAGFGESEATS